MYSLSIYYPKQFRLCIRNILGSEINHTSKAAFAKPATSMSPPTNNKLPATKVSTGPPVVSLISRTVLTACSMLGTT